MATGRIGTNTVLTTRWSKAPAGGTTSLSGLDDNSVSLVYSVGYEQVYRNGVLLSRGNDYTATNGTTITLIDATITGDIIEVFANATIPLTDTYSQSVANGKFINNTLTTTTGDIIYASAANTPARLGIGSSSQVLTVSGGVPTWTTPSTGAMTLIQRTSYSNVASQTFDSVFSTTYKTYSIIIEQNYAATPEDDLQMVMRYGTTDATSHYSLVNMYAFNSGTLSQVSISAGASMALGNQSGGSGFPLSYNLTVSNVGTGSNTYPSIYGIGYNINSSQSLWFGGYPYIGGQQYTGFKMKSASTNITGTISVYGWKDA